MLKMSGQRINKKLNPQLSFPFLTLCLHREGKRRASCGWGMTGKIVQESLSVIFICFFFSWIFLEAEGASAEERTPFAFPKGVQKGDVLQKKGGTEKTSQESAGGFRVTTILVSGQTKVAAINGVLMKKGDKVGDYKILEIEDKQVTLVRGKEKLVLKIDSTVGYSFKKLNSNHQVMELPK